MSVEETELHPDFIESACHFPHFVHIASQDVHAWAIEINHNAIALLLADHCIGIAGRHILIMSHCGFEDFIRHVLDDVVCGFDDFIRYILDDVVCGFDDFIRCILDNVTYGFDDFIRCILDNVTYGFEDFIRHILDDVVCGFAVFIVISHSITLTLPCEWFVFQYCVNSNYTCI